MHLSKHLVLASEDIDHLRFELGRRFAPHELNITKRNRKIKSEVCSCSVNRIGLLDFSYGDDAPIEAAVKEPLIN